jgi:hypothetical protein
MAKVVLVACVATKLNKPAPAEYLYVSDLFKKNLAYAKKLTNDGNIYILSAKNHLLPLKKKIAPYDKTLKNFDADAKKEWAEKVISQLKSKGYNLDKDQFVFLAGNEYRKYLEPEMKKTLVPFKGLRIGQQKSALLKKLKESFEKLTKFILNEIKNLKNVIK